MGSRSYVSLEMHKTMNHTIDEGGCGCSSHCYGIHGGIPYDIIACAPGDSDHGDTYPPATTLSVPCRLGTPIHKT
jgi:hypothetical protein